MLVVVVVVVVFWLKLIILRDITFNVSIFFFIHLYIYYLLVWLRLPLRILLMMIRYVRWRSTHSRRTHIKSQKQYMNVIIKHIYRKYRQQNRLILWSRLFTLSLFTMYAFSLFPHKWWTNEWMAHNGQSILLEFEQSKFVSIFLWFVCVCLFVYLWLWFSSSLCLPYFLILKNFHLDYSKWNILNLWIIISSTLYIKMTACITSFHLTTYIR